MPSKLTLDAQENIKVKIAIPAPSNKIYYSARARIYYAYAGTRKWSYAGIQGALVFSMNTSSNALHFQMVDLDGTGSVIWNYELYNGLVLDQEKTVTFFLSFEGDVGGDKCTIGFVFVDDSEAKNFYNHVKSNKDTKSAKLKRSSRMRSISKGSGTINKSMISRPKEGDFVHVAHMSYDADSGFTSKGVDPSWTALLGNLEGQLGKEVVANNMDFIKDFIRSYSERQQNQPVDANRSRSPPPLPPRTTSQNGAATTRLSHTASRTKSPQVSPHRSRGPIIEDDETPPPLPPRRPTPTHGPPPLFERPLPPQPSEPPLPRDVEANSINKGIHHSRLPHSENPPSPVLLSHSISRNRSTPPTIVPSRSASSTSNAGTLVRRQESHRSQGVDLPAPIFEPVQEDEAESLVPDSNQTAQRPSQSSQHDTAPWILASRTPHAPKKPMDFQFMVHMADIRRQTNESDASSTGSTPPVSLIGPRNSVTSSDFSQSLSVASSAPVVEFPPTPVFKDEIPAGVIRRITVTSPPLLYSSTSRGIVARG